MSPSESTQSKDHWLSLRLRKSARSQRAGDCMEDPSTSLPSLRLGAPLRMTIKEDK